MRGSLTLAAIAAAISMDLFAAGALRAEPGMTMPPRFVASIDESDLLAEYPLGSLSREAAFAHHGKPDRTVTLPNGLAGWVYEVHRGGKAVTYERGSGEEETHLERSEHPAVSTYTLVFDTAGKVVDVLFQTDADEPGESALAIQRAAQGDRPREDWVPGT